jgi:SAM-dependent methyltransferase
MSEFDYRAFYDRVGRENGWDFSRMKVVAEGVQWDFYAKVAQVCKPSDLLLDIGTGGGEAVLTIADKALLLVGIDLSEGMIAKAHDHLSGAKADNVRFIQMNAEQLAFPDRFFNVISCRHSAYCAAEVGRVLASDGVFLTQQVSEHDKWNIKQAFGRGQTLQSADGTLKNRYLQQLSAAGFTDVQTYEYDAVEYYETPDDLLFLLKHTPTIPDFGCADMDFQVFRQFVEDNRTERGIQTNSKRFMLIARRQK